MFENICRITSFLIVFLLITPVYATNTGNDLLRGCINMIKVAENNDVSVEDITDAARWAGYISGFLDAYLMTSLENNKMTYFCLPAKGMNTEQVARIVIKYLKDYPKENHQNARVCLIISLRDAFPCDK
jgi:hypothetical protein